MQYMPKTRRVFNDGGITFENAFVSTPICCPSRTSILTGLYAHNHNVHSNSENCSGSYWRTEFEPHAFAPYLKMEGYRTGFF